MQLWKPDGSGTPVSDVADDAILYSVMGTIGETSNGLRGDMMWGRFPISTTVQKQNYVYVAGATGPQNQDFSSGSTPVPRTNAYGDVDMSDYNFCFAPICVSGAEQGNLSTWLTLGHFTYIVSTAPTGTSASITFTPQYDIPPPPGEPINDRASALYQYMNSETGALSDPLMADSGFTATGPLTITTNLLTLPGDANLDGNVDGTDLNTVLSNYGMTSGATWAMGDFNGDGAVNGTDLNIVLSNYGTSSSAAAAVPEPYVLVGGCGPRRPAGLRIAKEIWDLLIGNLGLGGAPCQRSSLAWRLHPFR